MSRLPDPELEPDPDLPGPTGRVGTTPPGVLVVVGLVGLVLGWAVRPASIAWQGSAPRVAWSQPLALVLVALILAAVAWSTHRTVHTHRRTIEPHQAVNRLVLAKACAIAGAAAAGGYLWATPSAGSASTRPSWPRERVVAVRPGRSRRCGDRHRITASRTSVSGPSRRGLSPRRPHGQIFPPRCTLRPRPLAAVSAASASAWPLFCWGSATIGVLLAVPTQSPVWLTVSSVLALACGWAAARIVYTELVQSRRDHATDRAAQAQAYKSLFAERASEHAEFTTAMTDRMRHTDAEVADLQVSIVEAQRRAAEAENRVQREARRAAEADEKVAELEERMHELEALQAEQAEDEAPEPGDDTLATWDGFETVVDLMAWEEKVGAITAAARPPEVKKEA